MKRVTAVIAALIVAAGCSRTPTEPAADANRPRFTAQLLPSSEVPPVTNADATASGSAIIHLNLTRDAAGNITAATADFEVELSGFPPATNITGAHIHPGAAGTVGGVIVSTGVTSGEIALTNGVGTFTKTGRPASAANAQAIVNNPAGHYFNVHTTLNPGGAIRGQLVRTN